MPSSVSARTTKSGKKSKKPLGEFGWLNKVFTVLDVPGAKKLWHNLDGADGPETDEIIGKLRRLGALVEE